MTQFPRPVHLGPATRRWRVADLDRWEAAAAGRPEPDRDDTREVYLTDRQVAARYGVHRATIWRWAAESREGGALDAAD